MTSTKKAIEPPNGGNTPEQAQRRARFQQLQVRLRAQRKRMDQLAAAEFIEVVECIAFRLKSDDQPDLIAYHVRELWERRILDLPDGWQEDMTQHVRTDVERDPWFRSPMNALVALHTGQVKTIAAMLVDTHGARKRKASGGVKP